MSSHQGAQIGILGVVHTMLIKVVFANCILGYSRCGTGRLDWNKILRPVSTGITSIRQ